jgi:hypothetical protein
MREVDGGGGASEGRGVGSLGQGGMIDGLNNIVYWI